MNFTLLTVYLFIYLLCFFFCFFFLLTIFFTKWFYFINWHIMLHSRNCMKTVLCFLCVCLSCHTYTFRDFFNCYLSATWPTLGYYPGESPMTNFGPWSRWQPRSADVSHCVLCILTRRSLKLLETSLLKTGTISEYLSDFNGTQTHNH